MFGGLDTEKLEFLWLDGKKHTVQVTEGEDNKNLKTLADQYHKIVQEKEERSKQILYLGLGLTGNPSAAKGFLYGWIVKSIKDAEEKSGKPKWNIKHEERELSEDETRHHLAGELRELAERIEKDEEYKVKKAPILRGDVDDSTELFD